MRASENDGGVNTSREKRKSDGCGVRGAGIALGRLEQH